MDLNTIMEEIVLPDCPGPFYILAHSTGSLVALLAAPGFGNRIRRMVLSAPLLRLGEIGYSQEAVKFFSGLLTIIGLGEIYLPGSKEPGQQPFIGNKLTSDPDRFKRNQNFAEAHPELVIGGPTATWLFAAIKAMECLDDPEYHGHITIPTLLICAGSDQIVSSKAIELLGRRLRSGSALTIDGARHELLQERDIYREQLLSAFEAFIPGTELV